MNNPFSPEKPSVSRHLVPAEPEALPSLPPVCLAGKTTANGYQPENWQWLDVLTEPNPKRTDSTGRPWERALERRTALTRPIAVEWGLLILTGLGIAVALSHLD